MRDEIYKDKVDISKFTFDQKVVDVFDDMVLRSVPGYKQMIELIGLAGRTYPVINSNVYDLGCSTGAATLSIASNLKSESVKIFSIDNSQEMLNQCSKNLLIAKSNIQYICDDIENIQFENASLIVLNLTLQFINPKNRSDLIERIFKSLLPGGALIISEKIIHENEEINKSLISLHESFKRENGYSETEIAQKRKAIEEVLIPEPIGQHLKRLSDAGFKKPLVQMQCINFASFLAVK
ncbi:MAG: carboxy-S-adenosyl-L-methionine synthase CmoA [Gammaproteobacteria bacterium]